MIRWLAENKILAAAFALLSVIAFASAVDGCLAKARLAQAEHALQERDEKIEELARQRGEVEARLAKILEKKKRTWERPGGLDETANRFRALGY